MTIDEEITKEKLAREAISAAQWVTASPHEWQWTPEQQVAMARYVMQSSYELSLWQWLTDNNLVMSENAIVGAPRWGVVDIDDDLIAQGETPIEAIANAKVKYDEQSQSIRDAATSGHGPRDENH